MATATTSTKKKPPTLAQRAERIRRRLDKLGRERHRIAAREDEWKAAVTAAIAEAEDVDITKQEMAERLDIDRTTVYEYR